MRKLLSVAIVLLGSAPALALDGYQDRRGLFFGLAAGGGMSSPSEGDSEFGQRFAVRVGGGVSESLTLDVSGDFLFMGDDLGRVISFYGGAAYFFVPMAYVRGGIGFSHYKFDVGLESESDPGLAFQVGAGFEMFVNSDLAAGLSVLYDRQEFDGGGINQVTGLIGISWY
jgi:hypothetical protein